MASIACTSNFSFLLRAAYPNRNNYSFTSSNLIAKSTGTPTSLITTSSSEACGVGLVRASAQVADAVTVLPDKEETSRMLRVSLICEGPSAERGISLNSARFVLDPYRVANVECFPKGKDLHVSCCYIDSQLNAFAISRRGGTGINLTPTPASIISNEALERCKQRIELIANTLQLEGFSRIDLFVNVDSGEVLVIEVNTVPGMTPSTVLIHQALAEQPPMYPHQFFRTLFDLASERAL